MEKKWIRIETAPTWDFKEEPELEGFFLGVETEVGPNKSNLYSFRNREGDVIGVWGNTLLDTRFKNLEAGDEVKIIYKGKEESPKTGRIYHNFDVFKAGKNEEIPIIEEEK